MSVATMEMEKPNSKIRTIFQVPIQEADCDGSTFREKYVDLDEDNCVEIKEEVIVSDDEMSPIYGDMGEDIDENKIFFPNKLDDLDQAAENEQDIFTSDTQDPLLVETEKAYNNVDHDKKREFMRNQFACVKCGQQFSSNENLVELKVKHSKHIVYCCNICKKPFSKRKKSYICGVCSKTFSNKSNFNKHFRVHTKEKPHRCKLCGKGFYQLPSLREHNRVHTKEKPFTCEVCGKAFSQRVNLQTHLRVHTNEKPFSCEVCGRAFSQKASLERHKRTHKKKEVL